MTTAPRASALAPFGIRNYRFQWSADLATSWAFEMELIILGWYILVETGSVLLLTVYGALQYSGTLLAPMFGLLGDRVGHRNMLCTLRALYSALSLALMILAFTDLLSPTYVLAAAALFGIVRPSDLVMRQALVGAIMPPPLLMGAMGVGRTTQDTARIAGALAGTSLVATLGMGWAYVFITGFYTASMLLTFGVTVERPPVTSGTAAGKSSPWRDLATAAKYIWNTPYVLAIMCLACLVHVTVIPLLSNLMPYVAKDVYEVDQRALGYLAACLSTGALAGSIVLSNTSGLFRPARLVIASSILWHVLVFIFAQIGNAVVGAAVLFACGFLHSMVIVPMAAVMIRSSDPKYRGQVMGLRAVVVYSLPISLLILGQLIDRFGYQWSASLFCVAGLFLTLLIAYHWRAHMWKPDSPANAHS